MPVPAGSSPTPPSPSGPLYYDPVLSRVRITITGLPGPIADQFDRTVANGWGTSSSGHAWLVSGALPAQFSVNTIAGVHAVAAVFPTVYRSVLDVSLRDFALYLPAMLWPVSPTGDHVRTEVLCRYVNDTTYIRLMVIIGVGNAVDLRVESVVGGIAKELAAVSTGVTHSAGVSLLLRAELVGSSIRAKGWKDGAGEPAAWQVDVTDPAPQSGGVGILSLAAPANSNSKPFNVLYDGLTVTPLAVVERSTDGVRWTTVRGSGVPVPVSGTLRMDDYEFAPDIVNHYRAAGFAGSITPDLAGRAWLKSIARPFLNRAVTVLDYSDIERPARGGLFVVPGRTAPVAVTGVRGSRRWTLEVLTDTAGTARDVDLLLASGDILLVQAPAGTDVPAGYVQVGDTRQRRTSRLGVRRIFELPCTEVAAPTADVVGATATCQTVLDAYATCAALLAAHPTCLSVMELIGDPTEVIVP